MISPGLNFNHDGTNDVMTRVLVFSCKARRDEWLWHMVDIDNMFGQSLGFKNSHCNQLKEYNYRDLQSFSFLCSSYTGENCTTLYFSVLVAKAIKWPVMGASTLVLLIMLTIECRMVIIFWAQNAIPLKHMSCIFVLGATLNHKPLKYRRPNKKSAILRLSMSYIKRCKTHDTYTMHVDQCGPR